MKNNELKNYMESAGENDALSSVDGGILEYKAETREYIEKAIKELQQDLMNDWSSYGFEYGLERENIKEECDLKELSEDGLHDIVAENFEKYYIPAFLSKFESLANERFENEELKKN